MSKKCENASESKMSALCEAQTLVRRLAEPCTAGDSVKAQIGRAARRTGIGFNRIRSLWYGDERASVSAVEMDVLRRAVGARQNKVAAGRDELLARVEALEARLSAIDPDFYRPHVDTLRRAVSGMGRADNADA